MYFDGGLVAVVLLSSLATGTADPRPSSTTENGTAPTSPQLLAGGLWGSSAPLETARQDFKAFLLPSGPLQNWVLAIGGCCNRNGSLAGSELFDPEANTWREAGDLQNARWLFQATPLPNGSAIAVGGLGVASGGVLNSTELFVPGRRRGGEPSGAWQKAADMSVARQDFALVTLGDGRALAVGGFMASAELYNATTDTWTRTASMAFARSSFEAVLLDDGGVLAIGGRGRQSAALASSELFDPFSQTWETRGNLSQGRAYFAATKLPDGRVLVAGGKDESGRNLNSSEIYNPATGDWARIADMTYERSDCQAVVTSAGLVLVAGGLGGKSGGEIGILDTAEVYEPGADVWTPTQSMRDGRYVFQLVRLANGTVMALGGTSASGFTSSTEVFEAS